MKTSIALLALLLGASLPAQPQDSDAAAEKKKLAELQKERAVLEQNAARAAQAIGKIVQTDVLAWMTLRASAEGPDGSESAPLLQAAILQVFLREGLLLFPFEEEHKLNLEYKDGKLPKGSLLAAADLKFLSDRGVKYVALPIVQAKSPSYAVTIDVVQLSNGQKVASTPLGTVSAKKFTLKEVCELEVLPPLNVKVLTFAAANFGRQVDRGECWDLAAHPIDAAGGKIDGYKFGKEVSWDDARPGDIVTFGTSGETGGHVVVLYKWTKIRAAATILHQNVGGRRFVMLGNLGATETNKAGQKLAIWRP